MTLDPELQELGPRLEALRKRAGLTREELANRAGVLISTLLSLEHGKRQSPGIVTFIHLARGLGLTLNALLNELFPPP
jgi:transcriptional regulator with XRE-family HTH domain